MLPNLNPLCVTSVGFLTCTLHYMTLCWLLTSMFRAQLIKFLQSISWFTFSHLRFKSFLSIFAFPGSSRLCGRHSVPVFIRGILPFMPPPQPPPVPFRSIKLHTSCLSCLLNSSALLATASTFNNFARCLHISLLHILPVYPKYILSNSALLTIFLSIFSFSMLEFIYE